LRHRNPITALGVLSLVAGPALAACTAPPAPPSPAAEPTGKVSSALFANGGFEDGTNNASPPSWTVTAFTNHGVTIQTPQTRSGLDLRTTGNPTLRTVTLVAPAGAGPESQADPDLGTNASFRWPKFGNAVAIVNRQGNTHNANSMKQTMTVGAADIDSADGLAHVRFVAAPVLQDYGHPAEEQPYFFIQLKNETKGGEILYQDFNYANQPGVPWKHVGSGQNTIRYTDWALVDIAPGSAKLAPGDVVELEIIAAGCKFDAHYGHVYVDGLGPTVPGVFVSATGPSAANQNTDITYVLTYKNGGTDPAGNVIVEFNTPPGTTFTSVNAPGLNCTPPAVGTAGLVSCTVGNLAPGAGGSFPVTVHINNGTAPGTITAGNYSVKGDSISPLLGPKVYTNVTNGVAYANLGITMTSPATSVAAGGTVTYTIEVTNAGPSAVNGATVTDSLPSQLTNATWTCVGVDGATCTAGGNGSINDSATAIPVGGKLTYTVTATVSPAAAAAQLANVASVTVPAGATDPDPSNNSVGNYKQITAANGTGCAANTDCTSGACNPADQKCGYPNGTGPCTAANGGAVCREGACSANSTCMAVGQCNVDADCAGGNWCNMTTHQCTAKVPNDSAVPTDGAHTDPLLDGTCTTAAASLTCVSGVCDVGDDRCGYSEGSGPCTSVNAGTICRSGACSANGTCMPAAGCNVDADCTAGQWCNMSSHACTAKVPNGTAVPTDPGHTSPVLDGNCTTAAATLTCVSGVCDEGDDRCGYANDSGLCTAANAATVCRSGACSSNSTCMPAGGCNTDADCSGGKWCNVSEHKCTEKVANGSAVPTDTGHTTPTLDGKCTTEAATLTCVSGVCDSTDNRCGYADGKGPCTAGNGGVVCRSGSCSATGVCKPAKACNVDSDCDTATQYCDTGVRACTAKLQNGTSMPAVKDHKPALDGKCSKEAAAIVCESGVCDPTDDKCGYGNGVGPCSVANAATVCRAGACDPKDNKCGLADESGPCSNDSVCRSNDCDETKKVCGSGCKADGECAPNQYCKSDGTCSLKRPDGDKCAGANQCQSGGCENEVCDSVLASGNGLACSVRAVNGSNGGAGAAVFGVMLAAAGLFRRRRSARS